MDKTYATEWLRKQGVKSCGKLHWQKSKIIFHNMENDPRFLKRILKSRASLLAAKGIPWEEIEVEENP